MALNLDALNLDPTKFGQGIDVKNWLAQQQQNNNSGFNSLGNFGNSNPSSNNFNRGTGTQMPTSQGNVVNNNTQPDPTTFIQTDEKKVVNKAANKFGNLNAYGNAMAAYLAGDLRKTERRREAETDEAIYKNRADRERIMALSPEATRQAQASQLMSSQAEAMNAAANVGASSASGMSGDIDSALLAGIKASAPVAQTNAQYASQLAQGHQQAYQSNEAKNAALGQNTGQLAQLGELTHYTTYADPKVQAQMAFYANMPSYLKAGAIEGREYDQALFDKKWNTQVKAKPKPPTP